MNDPLLDFLKAGQSNSVVTDQILDNLEKVESGGNPLAVNRESGAQGAYQFLPATTKWLSKKYGNFDPFNRDQSRDMARRYLEDLHKETGSIEGALKRYGGFITKDASNYVGRIVNPGENKLQLASTDDESDSLLNFMAQQQPRAVDSVKAPKPTSIPTEQAAIPAATQAKSTAQPQAQLPTGSQLLAEGAAINRNVVEGFGGAKGIAAYWASRPSNTAEQSSKIAEKTSLTDELYKLFTGKEREKKEAAPTAFDRQLQFIGENIGQGAQWLSDKTGIPKTDIEQALAATGILAFKKPIKAGFAEIKTATGKIIPEPIKAIAAKTTAVIDKVTPTGGMIDVRDVPDVVRPPLAENYQFSATPTYSQKANTKATQIETAQLLKRTGADDVHPTVIKGDGPGRSTLWAVAQTDTPMGAFVRDRVFNKEHQVVDGFSKQIIDDTGGSHGLDQSALIKRGRAIEAPVVKLDEYIEKQKKVLYAKRDEQAADVPVKLDKTRALLDDPEIATTEELALKTKALARMKSIGIIDKDGNVLDTNGKKAEQFRQFINENKYLARGGLWNLLRNTIDEDVFSYAGSRLYDDARKLHILRKELIDNPKGISNLIESEGVNRKVSYEKMANNVISLPHEQLAHIVDTLKNKMPDEIKADGIKALNEIKAQYANKINELGNSGTGGNVKQWNAKKVSQFLNDSNADMHLLFSPQEMTKFADLSDLGQRFRTDTGYKGAAVQSLNLGKTGIVGKGAEWAALAGVEAATGGATFGTAGALAKGTLAARNKAAAEARAVRKEEKKLINLKDVGRK